MPTLRVLPRIRMAGSLDLMPALFCHDGLVPRCPTHHLVLAPGRLVRPEREFGELNDGSEPCSLRGPLFRSVPPEAARCGTGDRTSGPPLAPLSSQTLSPARRAGRGHKFSPAGVERRMMIALSLDVKRSKLVGWALPTIEFRWAMPTL